MDTKDKKHIINLNLIHITGVGVLKEDLTIPSEFDIQKVDKFDSKLTPSIEVGKTDKNVRVILNISISTLGKNKENATIELQIGVQYVVENIHDLIVENEEGLFPDINLFGVLVGTAYSTVRGILMTRLQYTPFNNFILPIISPYIFLEKAKND
ncbi:hypothetical protein WAF17_02410 [Bernardetia sp. ABR2-2B]|uniref:hypothetical protein n=1 Tax=Bernardetia sp. ABR2-2B TaxID=3127472 RepID=UPI0030CF0890